MTSTLGLITLVYGFTQAAPSGYEDGAHWTDPSTLAWFGIAAVLLVSFFVIEARSANPLLPLRVILERNRGGAYLTMLITGAGMFAMFLFLGLYLQVILQYSPVQAGFAFLPFSLGIILAAGIAANLLPKVGPRPLMVPGLIAGAVGMFWLAQLEPDSNYWTHVLPAMVIMSVGMAFNFIPTATRGPARRRPPRRRCRLRGAQHLAAGRRLAGHGADEHRGGDRDLRLPRREHRARARPGCPPR